MLFSIITPVFNRCHLLERIAISIQDQINFDINKVEWIIVDDGSIDGIDQVVQHLKINFQFKIVFLQKINGGKHTAVNEGIKIAQGDTIFILDSDDYLINTALDYMAKAIIREYHVIDVFLDRTSCVEKFEKEIYDLNEFLSLQTEAIFCIKTDILKQTLFPEYPGEKFMAESAVWNLLITKYMLYTHNYIVVEKAYLSDGLTHNYHNLLKDSPKGVYEFVLRNCRIAPFKLHVIKQSSFHYAAIISGTYNYSLAKDAGLMRALPTIVGAYYVLIKKLIW